jgi:uncharacterized glyoxalase superfamily protein PhnB
MQFEKVTPNLMVRDVTASLNFYQQVLGLERQFTNPDQEPFVFVSVGEGDVEIFLNKSEAGSAPVPGGISLYLEVSGLDQLLGRVEQGGVKIEIPLHETFYGMREFAVLDPGGYLIIFAERAKK